MIKKWAMQMTSQMKSSRLSKDIIFYAKDSKSILDVGCGDMIITNYIQQSLPKTKLHGVDVIDYRLAKIPFTKYAGDVLPFKSGSFDTVIAILALHHCKDEWKTFLEMVRVAKNYVIFIEEVYDNKLELEFTKFHDWITNSMETDEMNLPFNFHKESEWLDFGKKLGCEVVEVKRIYQFPLWLTIILGSFTKQKVFVLKK